MADPVPLADPDSVAESVAAAESDPATESATAAAPDPVTESATAVEPVSANGSSHRIASLHSLAYHALAEAQTILVSFWQFALVGIAVCPTVLVVRACAVAIRLVVFLLPHQPPIAGSSPT